MYDVKFVYGNLDQIDVTEEKEKKKREEAEAKKREAKEKEEMMNAEDAIIEEQQG